MPCLLGCALGAGLKTGSVRSCLDCEYPSTCKYYSYGTEQLNFSMIISSALRVALKG